MDPATPTACWWHQLSHLERVPDPAAPWWQHAAIYQIYPASFKDTQGSGIGDLNGAIQQLDYIASLGVDAVWLSPIFASAMDDFGYDVTDMLDIDPTFGDLETFDRFVDIAHHLGLKVILDQVWNHTSDRHPWFRESRQSRTNPKADWYVWADANPDGGPPNNWLSTFCGQSAWRWDEPRQQYYLCNFFVTQPDLNWHNPEVVQAILERGRFWLERGVDGFRLDAANFYRHDRQLRDNPPRTEDMPDPEGIEPDNPMARNRLQYNFQAEETIAVLKEIRALVAEYPHRVLLGEVMVAEDSVELAGRFVGEDRLHLAYNAALLEKKPLDVALLRRIVMRVHEAFPNGGQCWMVGNHDYGRLRSRWTGVDATGDLYPDAFYRMVSALLVALPGALCLYQGDELGLPVAEIPREIPVERLQDPFGADRYPDAIGRDGSRTPMPWKHDAPYAGFSTVEPWLPIPERHFPLAVDRQHIDPDSSLNTWRRLLNWRKYQPALLSGKCVPLPPIDPGFAFIRHHPEQRLLCLFNPSRYAIAIRPDQKLGWSGELPPYGVWFVELPLEPDEVG